MSRLTFVRDTTVRSLAKAEYVYDPSSGTSTPFTIGRSGASSMLLSSDGQRFNISRRHAEVRFVKTTDSFVLVDLGAMNGVFVNGVRIDAAGAPVTLRGGDVVTFGGGANVAAGQKVSQPKSEFVFRVLITPSSASATMSPPPAKRARLGRSSCARTGAGVETRSTAMESESAAAAAPTKAKLAALESELKASRAAASATLAAELAKQRSVQETMAKAAASRAAMEAERARAAGAAKLAQLKAELAQAEERARTKEAEVEHERAAKASACERQEELLSCGVCMDLLVHTLVLTCGHSYCAACWHDWRARKEADAKGEGAPRVVCPICCQPVVPGSAVPGRVIDDNVELFVQQLAVGDERRTAYEERSAAARAASNAAAAAAANTVRLAPARDMQRGVKAIAARGAARGGMPRANDLRHFFIDLT